MAEIGDECRENDKENGDILPLCKELSLFLKGKLLTSSNYFHITDKYYRLERNCSSHIDFMHLEKMKSSDIEKAERCGYQQLRILLLTTKAGIYYTHNKTEECQDTVTQAHELYEDLQEKNQNCFFLFLRIAAFQALWAMKEGKWGLAEKWINQAANVLFQVEPCEETARIFYLFAKFLTHNIISKPSDELRDKIIAYLAVSRMHLIDEYRKSEGQNAKMKTHVPFRTTGIIKTLLDYPDYNVGRGRGVEYITKAALDICENLLDLARKETQSDATCQTRARLHILESGFHLRWAQMYEKLRTPKKAQLSIMKAWNFIKMALNEVGGTRYQQAIDADEITILNLIIFSNSPNPMVSDLMIIPIHRRTKILVAKGLTSPYMILFFAGD